jgi:hypothetical protein
MIMLLVTMMFNQRINDFSAHQAPPPWHPYFSTCGHVHKVIHNHGSLASRALHQLNLLQQVAM